MKVKDLPPGTNMGGIKVKTTGGFTGYWVSQWQKGVWLSKNSNCAGNMYPQFVEHLSEAAEWEVVDENYNNQSKT